MNKYLLFIFLFISTQANCQSNCNCFERLYQLAHNENDNRKSAEILKDALSFLPVENRGEYYWEVAESYRRSKLYDSSAIWYEKAVAEGGYNIDNLKWQVREVYNRMDTSKMKAIICQRKATMNFYLYEKFTAQLILDQSIREDVLFSYDKVWDTASPVCQRDFVDSMYHRVDDSTYRFLMWVFDIYGYPTVQKLGFYPSGITQMILHVTAYKNENADRLLKKLEELNRNCEYMKYDILFLLDRQKYYKEKKTYCGLISRGGDEYSNIEDLGKADSIRLEYNRVRLKEENVWSKEKLPDNYKPRPYPKNYFCLKKYNVE